LVFGKQFFYFFRFLIRFFLAKMAARYKQRTAETHERHCSALEKWKPDWTPNIIMIGDSNFERLAKIPEFGDFAERKAVFCAGIGGDRVCNMLWRLTQAKLRLQALAQPRLIVLMAGSNDVESMSSPQALAREIQNLVWEIKTQFGFKETHVMLMSILPRTRRVMDDGPKADPKETTELNQKIRETNKLLSKLDYLSAFEDFHSQFSNGDGSLREEYFRADGVHLNEDGYLHFMIGLENAIDYLFTKLEQVENKRLAKKTAKKKAA
jgi:hypothetical protein